MEARGAAQAQCALRGGGGGGGRRACTAARVALCQSLGSAVMVMLTTHVPSRALSAISYSIMWNCASPSM